MDEPVEPGTAASLLRRDPDAMILFGIGLCLIVLLLFAGAVFARTGHIELLKATLLLTVAFAFAGMVLGLVRGLRSGREASRRNA